MAWRANGCYFVSQPHAGWAGERAAKMRGEIRAEPVKHFFTQRGAKAWSGFPTIETLVWDLHLSRKPSDHDMHQSLVLAKASFEVIAGGTVAALCRLSALRERL